MLRIEGEQQLARLAVAMKGAEKPLRREITKSLRLAVKPLGPKVISEGAAGLPHRGGLSARVSKYRATPGAALGTGNPQVRLLLKKVRGYDRGYISHPVFGRKGGRALQRTRSGEFTRAFESHAGEVAPFVQQAMRTALDEIARRA